MKIRSFLMLSVVIFLWGSAFILLKLGLDEVPPITLAFLRFLLVLPFFMALNYFQNKHVLDKSFFSDWKIFALLGLTGVTLYHTFQNIGLKFTTASNSSFIISANPVFIVLFDHFYSKERLNLKKNFGIILAFFGIALIIGPLRLTLNPMELIGDLLSLGAAIYWALYSILGKKALSSYSALKVTTFSLIYGTLFLFPLLFILEKPILPTSTWLWFLIIILSLLCSGLAYLFWYKALEDVSASKAGVFLFIMPIISVSIAHVVLTEPLDLLFGIGALLIMLGVIITERS